MSDAMYCPNCGQKVPANAEFCPNCGYQFKNQTQNVRNKQPNGSKKLQKVLTIAIFLTIGLLTLVGIVLVKPYITQTNKTNRVNSSKAITTKKIPSQFQGTWYSGNNKMTIADNKITGDSDKQDSVTTNTSPLKLDIKKGMNGSYELYKGVDDQKKPTYFWLGKMKIDGDNQTVLAKYDMNHINGKHFIYIATKQPATDSETNDGYRIKVNESDASAFVGNKDLAALKAKRDAELNNDPDNADSNSEGGQESDIDSSDEGVLYWSPSFVISLFNL